MTWKTIRLELARTPEFPEGSPYHAYLLRLPLDHQGLVDEREYEAANRRPSVQRVWPGDPVKTGVVIRKLGGWAFSYEPGDADDEGIFHLENHPIRLGDYLTITEASGERLPYRVVACRD